jgi:hypothetical protein
MAISDLIAQANAFRMKTLNALQNAAASGKAIDVTTLSVNASRPMALGFSLGDLRYAFDVMTSRHHTFSVNQANAESASVMLNTELSMYVAKTYAQKRDKENLAATARRAGQAARMEATYASAAAKVLGAIYAEIFRREVANAQASTKPVSVIAPQPVVTPTKPISYKKPVKNVRKVAQCRGEITLKGFDALAEYAENTAMILG